MSQLNPLIPMIFLLPFIVFWLWMFRDMMNNDNLPSINLPTSIARDSKSDWTLLFVFMNVFAAAIYYANVYRNRN